MSCSVHVLQPGHILDDTVLPGELIRPRKVVDTLVRPQAGESVRPGVRSGPEEVEIAAVGRDFGEAVSSQQGAH